MWWRDVTPQVRVAVRAPRREPILGMRTDLSRPPAAIIALSAARVPRELSRREVKQDLGLGDYQGQSWLAIQRVVRLALTACWLWRRPLLRDPPAPWLTTATAMPAGKLTPLRGQRRHRALRRLGVPRILAAAASGADSQKPEVSDARIARIAA